jgi:hypothetical protein
MQFDVRGARYRLVPFDEWSQVWSGPANDLIVTALVAIAVAGAIGWCASWFSTRH